MSARILSEQADASETDTSEIDWDALARITANMGYPNDAALARKLGMSHTTIGRIRRGECKPGEKFIARLTGRLGIPHSAVFVNPKAS